MGPRQNTKFRLNYHMIKKICRENCYPSFYCDQFLCSVSDTSVNINTFDSNDKYLNSTSNNSQKRLAYKNISCRSNSISHSENNTVQNFIEIDCSSKGIFKN